MNWNDYEAAWKRQPLPVGADANLKDLRATFETKRRKLAATLLVRDCAEFAACVLVIVFYVRFWQKVGASGWPMAIAILLILGVALMFLHERWRIRRQRLAADAPLLAKIEADIAELRHQRTLLLKLWTWYLGPCAAAIAIHGYVIIGRAKSWDVIRHPLFFASLAACFAFLFLLVWAINRRAVRQQIEPRLEELEQLHRDILAPNS